MKTKISVVLCTYNNANSLALTLHELSSQDIPSSAYLEVIVVDNNSPDHTATVVAPYLNRSNIDFHYVFEGRQGLSHARNTGVSRANGDYILFTDDDAAIPKNWIREYINHIEIHQPDCLYSKIDIIWDHPKPWWFVSEFTPCFVGLDYGNDVIEVRDNKKEFYGKNFCIRKTLLIENGGFDPALGRNGNNLGAGEETLLYRKMIDQGKSVIYFPSAPVGHRLKPREYSEENIKKLYIDGAHSTHHIAKICARKTMLGRPLGLLLDAQKSLLFSSVGLIKHTLSNNKSRRHFHQLCLLRSLKIISLWITQ